MFLKIVYTSDKSEAQQSRLFATALRIPHAVSEETPRRIREEKQGAPDGTVLIVLQHGIRAVAFLPKYGLAAFLRRASV